MKDVSVCVLALLFLSVAVCNAQSIKLPAIFGTNMLLQRDVVNPVWGFAPAGTSVVVNFDNKDYTAVTSSSGIFSVNIDAHSVGGDYTMTFKTGTPPAPEAILTNIIFGDLFLCSGQSNMQMTVSMVYNATTEIANANYPDIRMLSAFQYSSLTPLNDIVPYNNGWQPATPSSVGGDAWQYMSATCYFFGRDTHLAMNVPIGLVASDYGGTIIEAWSSPDVLHQCGYSVDLEMSDNAVNDAPPNPNTPTVLWNAMIEPLLSLRFRAVVWYQGESNAFNPLNYTCLFPAMIADWRAKFQLPDMHFYFVQVSSWYAGGIIAALRGAQESGLKEPNTGMATAFDLSDWQSPWNCIHPRNKQEVGRRLMLQVVNKFYKQAALPCENSFYLNHTVIASPDNVFTAEIKFVPVYGGLVWNASLPEKGESGFEVCVGDDTWVPATAVINGEDTVVISAAVPSRTQVTHIRYAWADWPICSIYNSAMLPALQFWADVTW